MGREDKISQRQLMATACISIFSPAVRLLPGVSAAAAGKAAWLTPIAAVVPVLLYTLMMSYFMKSRSEGEGLIHLIIRSVGNVAGKAAVLLITLWLIFYSGFLLRTAGERLLSDVYENGKFLTFIALTLLAAVMVARGRVKSLGRMAEVAVPIISAIIIFVIAFSVSDVEAENLLPITYYDVPDILLGTLPVINVMTVMTYFLFLSGYVEKSPDEKRLHIKWTGYLLIAAFFITSSVIGTLSSPLVTELQNPFFMMIKNITVLGIIERIEVLIISIWVITDFVFLAALFMITSESVSIVTGIKRRKHIVLPIAALSLASCFLISDSAFGLQVFSSRIIPAVNLIIVTVLVPIILIIGKIRKRI